MTKLTIKDIARIAEVSAGTVDRVLHKRGEVSEETRKRVELVIAEYNFKPDIIASNLAMKRGFRFAVIMPDSVNEHEFWDLPKTGIENTLEEVGHFKITIDYIRFSQTSKKDFVKRIKNLPFDNYNGILFAPVYHDESKRFLEQCAIVHKPVVLFNSVLEDAVYDSFVGQDAFKSGYLAGKLMSYGLPGIRDLLVINLSARKDNYAHIIKRENGFRSYFEEHPERIGNMITANMSGIDDMKLNGELDRLIREHDIAGIFVTNSRVYRVAAYLSNKGVMNMRLIGYDLLPASREYLRREYIDFLISQKPDEQARIGLMTLVNLCILNKEPNRKQFLPIDIITKENIEFYK
ncbi:MAG: LacI family DNA-binding transcriptional regulator [Bacteroidales bacterium]|nr:LacI family DNA-binding transcriptional regulator [Bacteroidales bacterium]